MNINQVQDEKVLLQNMNKVYETQTTLFDIMKYCKNYKEFS